MTTPIDRLTAMGFKKCGSWQLKDEKLKYLLSDSAIAVNVLYAFVSAGTVLYVGKTVQSLQKRMYGYQNPGPTQSTNKKGNRLIKELLAGGATVEIYALLDNGLLFFGGFHVNLAAGLEDSLVAQLKPTWNKAGMVKNIDSDKRSHNQSK